MFICLVCNCTDVRASMRNGNDRQSVLPLEGPLSPPAQLSARAPVSHPHVNDECCVPTTPALSLPLLLRGDLLGGAPGGKSGSPAEIRYQGKCPGCGAGMSNQGRGDRSRPLLHDLTGPHGSLIGLDHFLCSCTASLCGVCMSLRIRGQPWNPRMHVRSCAVRCRAELCRTVVS